MLRDWLNAVLKTGPVAQTKWVEEISRLGQEKQKQFLRYFNHLLEQAVRLRTAGIEPGDIKEKDFAERLNKIAGIEHNKLQLKNWTNPLIILSGMPMPKYSFMPLLSSYTTSFRTKLYFW